ncbi:MAG: glycosyltransferase family 4 protein [Pirellulales bacterium]
MTSETFFIIAECSLAFFVALLASSILTPIVRSRAQEWDFVDRPDGGRKAHARPVALGGGVAVLLSALIAAGLTFAAVSGRHESIEERVASLHKSGLSEREIVGRLQEQGDAVLPDRAQDLVAAYDANPQAYSEKHGSSVARLKGYITKHAKEAPFFFALLASSLLICMVGLLDDFVALPGRYKLAGQVLAALVLIAAGLVIDRVSLFNRTYTLGIMSIPFTLFWILGAINAINLLDGIDGLASSVGFVLSLSLATLALLLPQMHEAEAIIAMVMAGSLLGFLRFNFNPASIFLGDSGSMVIGLVIGAVAIRCSFKGVATVGLAVPFALWAIPILDSAAAILRRKLTGRSLFATDRGHLHHSLLVRGWSVRRAVLFITFICALTCCGALLSYYLRNEYIAWTTVFIVAVFLAAMGIFGHVEFALVRERVRSTTRSFAGKSGRRIHESRVRLQGSQEWEHLWSALTESAEDYNIARIELTLNMPALNEAFYANWNCDIDTADAARSWRLVCPLVVDGRSVGQLIVVGISPREASLSHIGQVADFLDPVEDSIRKVVAEISLPAAEAADDEASHETAELEMNGNVSQPIAHGVDENL